MKVAVVTGASDGIGKATAAALSKHGYSVAMIARSEDKFAACPFHISKLISFQAP